MIAQSGETVIVQSGETVIVQSGETVGVSGTRVVDKDGFIVSETGSCVVGSVAWLERQKNIEAALKLMRGLDGGDVQR